MNRYHPIPQAPQAPQPAHAVPFLQSRRPAPQTPLSSITSVHPVHPVHFHLSRPRTAPLVSRLPPRSFGERGSILSTVNFPQLAASHPTWPLSIPSTSLLPATYEKPAPKRKVKTGPKMVKTPPKKVNKGVGNVQNTPILVTNLHPRTIPVAPQTTQVEFQIRGLTGGDLLQQKVTGGRD